MSLTSVLAIKESPIRQFMEREFPGTSPICKAANATIRAGRSGEPPVAPVAGVDGALVGTALEYVLPVPYGRVREAQVAGAPTPELALGRMRAAEMAIDELRRLGVDAEPLTGDALERAADCALVCARLEQRYRMGDRRARELGLADPAVGVLCGLDGAITASSVGSDARADLISVLKAGLADTSDLYRAKTLAIDPTFALSAAVGGADADLIADGALIDLKSGKGRSLISAKEIYQLIGYSRLDTDDRYAITKVGIHAVRWRTRWTTNLDELLASLSGTPRALPTWRQMFAEVAQIQEHDPEATL